MQFDCLQKFHIYSYYYFNKLYSKSFNLQILPRVKCRRLKLQKFSLKTTIAMTRDTATESVFLDVNNLGRIRAPKPRDYLNFQGHHHRRRVVAGSHRREREVTNMFTRGSTPQVRRFTRLSVSLFGASRDEGQFRARRGRKGGWRASGWHGRGGGRIKRVSEVHESAPRQINLPFSPSRASSSSSSASPTPSAEPHLHLSAPAIHLLFPT